MNLNDIRQLPLEQKKVLLAMLQASIGDKVEVDAPKLTEWQIESMKCNKIATLRASGCTTICLMAEFDQIVPRKQKIATRR